MTRLREDWLKTLEKEAAAYERSLYVKTGLGFVGIAAAANGLSEADVRAAARNCKAAVVPVTSGQGVIGGFAASVAAILRLAGFCVYVTGRADVDGIYEAHRQDARMVFMADDRRYIGFRLDRRLVSDNDAATARGFVAALSAMSGGALANEDVLVLGCGSVGQLSVAALIEHNARPVVYDKDPAVQRDACARLRVRGLHGPAEIAGYRYVVDATNEGGWLKSDMLHSQARIAAPGVPLSLDAGALETHGTRLVHDLLHIGTLAMAGELCKP